MQLSYVDTVHERDEESKEYNLVVHVGVQDIGRTDAAVLADALEQCALRFTESVEGRAIGNDTPPLDGLAPEST